LDSTPSASGGKVKRTLPHKGQNCSALRATCVFAANFSKKYQKSLSWCFTVIASSALKPLLVRREPQRQLRDPPARRVAHQTLCAARLVVRRSTPVVCSRAGLLEAVTAVQRCFYIAERRSFRLSRVERERKRKERFRGGREQRDKRKRPHTLMSSARATVSPAPLATSSSTSAWRRYVLFHPPSYLLCACECSKVLRIGD
jgi:hypothetical protein